MLKKWLVVGGVVFLTLVITGGLIWWRGRQVVSQELNSNETVGAGKIVPTAVVSLVTHTDPAGFTIQYPQNLQVNLHDEDKNNYAHVEFTEINHPGGVTYFVKDLPSKVNADGRNLATWIAGEMRFKGGIVADTTLGGQPAKKVLLSQDKTSVILSVFDGVLYEVQVIKTDNDYWSEVAEGIISSTKLIPVVNTTNPVGDQGQGVAPEASGGEIIEEEEIVE